MEKKEAMKILKDFYDKSALFSIRTALDTVIPELKESEDERIRKELLNAFQESEDSLYMVLTPHRRESFITWLEKQGSEPKKDATRYKIAEYLKNLILDQSQRGTHMLDYEGRIEEEVDFIINIAKKELKKEKQGNLVKYYEDKLDRCACNNFNKGYKKALERQGKQKTVDEIAKEVCKDKASAVAFLKSAGIMNEKGELAEQYRQDEQKPIDKVEPKFNVDDWVVNTITKEVEQVIELTSCEYICSGHLIVPFNNQHLLKRWTIQDAKDGDVLLSPSTPEGDKECPFIFKEIDKSGIVRYHAALLQSENFKIADGITNVMGYANAGYHTPANKEQRDLLFQKMHEAGYEWDAEKKKLKKIEQNTIDNVIEEEKPLLEKFKQAVYDCAWEKVTCKVEGESKEEYANRWAEQLLIIVRDWADDYIDFTVQQKLRKVHNKWKEDVIKENISAWSEEDNIMARDIDYALRCQITYPISRLQSMSNWILNLKDRVQPQQQEWRKEIKEELNKIVKYLRYKGLEDDADFLESLNPQNKWKPSEEQMKAMEEVRTIFHNHHLWDEINPILYDYEELMRKLKSL